MERFGGGGRNSLFKKGGLCHPVNFHVGQWHNQKL